MVLGHSGQGVAVEIRGGVQLGSRGRRARVRGRPRVDDRSQRGVGLVKVTLGQVSSVVVLGML